MAAGITDLAWAPTQPLHLQWARGLAVEAAVYVHSLSYALLVVPSSPTHTHVWGWGCAGGGGLCPLATMADGDAHVWTVPIVGPDVPGGRVEMVLVQTSSATPVCVMFHQVRAWRGERVAAGLALSLTSPPPPPPRACRQGG